MYHLDTAGVDAAEKDAVFRLNVELSTLNAYVRRFEAARQLHFALRPDNVSGDAAMLSAMTFIPFRDAAMTLFHYSKVIDHKLSAQMKDCPKFRENINHGEIKKAKKEFSNTFPNIDRLRNSVAHHGELSIEKDGTTKALEVTSAVTFGGGGQLLVPEILVDSKFTGMIEGETYSFELTQEASQALSNITKSIQAAFPHTIL